VKFNKKSFHKFLVNLDYQILKILVLALAYHLIVQFKYYKDMDKLYLKILDLMLYSWECHQVWP